MAGGTDYPKVEDLDGLADYGNSVLNFAESYTSAVNQTYRTYGDATSYQNGAAIEAFLTKLETLQSQLFDQFPLALETYGNTVAIYYSALTGEGFQNRMWSDTTGASELNTRYTSGDQKVAIDETTHRLKEAFDHAAELAEVEAPDLNGIKTSALDAFESAGKKRTTKASSVDSAWTSFTSNLSSNAATIKAFQAVIDNATYLVQIPANEFVTQIMSGSLPAEHMYYLDGIRNKDDVEVAKILIKEGTYASEEDFFYELGKINYADKLSDNMVDVIYSRVALEMHQLDENGQNDSLGYFFQSMTINLTTEEASNYAKELSFASGRIAASIKAQALGAMPDFPAPGAPASEYEAYYNKLNDPTFQEGMAALNGEIQNAGLLNNVFEYIYANELGYGVKKEAPTSADGSERQDIKFNTKFIYANSLSFVESKSNPGVKFTVRSGEVADLDSSSQFYKDPYLYNEAALDEYTFVDSTIKSTSSEIETDKSIKRINELREEQQQNTKDYIANLIVDGTQEIPVVNTITSTTKTLLYDGDAVGAVSGLIDDVPGKDTVEAIYEDIVNYKEQVNVTNEEIKDEENNIKGNLFDVGGTTVKENNETVSAGYNATYDLGATIAQNDFEENGIRSYIYRNSRSLNHDNAGAVAEVNNFDQNNTDKTLSGENNKTIDRGKNKITSQEVYDKLQDLDEYDEDFSYGSWVNDNSSYFDRLIGNKTQMTS